MNHDDVLFVAQLISYRNNYSLSYIPDRLLRILSAVLEDPTTVGARELQDMFQAGQPSSQTAEGRQA